MEPDPHELARQNRAVGIRKDGAELDRSRLRIDNAG